MDSRQAQLFLPLVTENVLRHVVRMEREVSNTVWNQTAAKMSPNGRRL